LAESRREVIERLYESGLPLREIGPKLGLSHERIRQLLSEYGVGQRSIAERRYETSVSGRESIIVRSFLRTLDDDVVALELGIDSRHVRRCVDEAIPDAGVLRRRRRHSTERYGEEELVAALQEAAGKLPSPLTVSAYRDWAGGRQHDGRPWPGPQAIMLRFGGWGRALTRAGLPANPPGGPSSQFDWEDAVEALASSWRELGRYPSVVRYDEWRAGKRDFPSSAAIRHHARSWDDLLFAAYPLVHGLEIEADIARQIAGVRPADSSAMGVEIGQP
jgi:hypothetical protein